MNKLIILGVIGLLFISFASAYICIYPETDNAEVQKFKMKINELAVNQDIQENNLTEEQLKIKLKYFGPCR